MITHTNGLATISYASRDNAGDPLSMGDWTGTWSYGYDDNNRLTSATAPNPVPDQPAGGIYGYDWVGNRIHPPSDPNPMVYNKADQLTSWPGMHTYTYYGDGSLNQVKDSSGTNVLRSYTYTNDGLLASATYNSRTLTNTWDASKNRVSFTAGGNTHTFVYDTTSGIPAVIDEDGVYYVREPDGQLISRINGLNQSYYHFDALGSTRLLTDSDGDVTDMCAYDAYGSLISHYALIGHVDQPYQYVGKYGYYTHYHESEFGLLQLGVRFYDSEVGRFTQNDDIIRNGTSRYAYCEDKPIIRVDPQGETSWVTCIKCKEFYDNVYRAAHDCKQLYWARVYGPGGDDFFFRNPNSVKWIRDCQTRRVRGWYPDLDWYVENCSKLVAKLAQSFKPPLPDMSDMPDWFKR